VYGLACLPLIGTLTTVRLAKYDGTGCNSTPSFFSFYPTCHHRTRPILLAIIHAAGILTAILIDIVLIASYLLSSTPPASSLPSSLASYSSCRIVQLPTVCRSESCANNLTKLVDHLAVSHFLSSTPPASSPPSSLTSYSLCLTYYHPCRRHPHRHPH